MDNQNHSLDEDLAEQSQEIEEEQGIEINETKLQAYYEQLESEQNLSGAIIIGIVAVLLSAALWAIITIITDYQIGFMAIGVGIIVGFAIRYAGKGIEKFYGYLGAVFALIGCLMGNFLTIMAYAAQDLGISFLEVIPLIDYARVPSILVETFHPMDFLFYGLAIYEGYKFSFRNITEEEIIENATDPVSS